MKKYLLFFVCLFVANLLKSQDLVTRQNGEEIKVKVIEITDTDLKYKKFDNQDGPIYNMKLKDIFMIVYENGSKEVFTAKNNESKANSEDQDAYQNGISDAKVYYKSYKLAGTITLLSSILSPLIGLAPAVAFTVTSPNDDNLDYPSREKMKNPDYSQAYKSKAKNIKTTKVWTNWGIGLGVNIALLFLLL